LAETFSDVARWTNTDSPPGSAAVELLGSGPSLPPATVSAKTTIAVPKIHTTGEASLLPNRVNADPTRAIEGRSRRPFWGIVISLLDPVLVD
jgi:hypothetical protein